MFYDIETILFFIVLILGVLTLWDKYYCAPRRVGTHITQPKWAEHARSFFPVLLLVFLLRSFLIEPFRIPSSSLVPTLLIGDFLLVNKFTYGIRLPVINKKIIAIDSPKRGDIMVFRYPANPSLDYIKRVIGLPGDHITYKNKQLTINGKPVPQTFLRYTIDNSVDSEPSKVAVYSENINGVVHQIYRHPGQLDKDYDLIVPPEHYFMMGDNRDNSNDSRYWGTVPEANIIGKAFLIWFSWDSLQVRPRFNRIGQSIQ